MQRSNPDIYQPRRVDGNPTGVHQARSTLACAAVALVATVWLAGCSRPGDGPSGGADLAGTCQFRACVCMPDDAAVWAAGRAAPVRWGHDGAASCPPGYTLKLQSAKK